MWFDQRAVCSDHYTRTCVSERLGGMWTTTDICFNLYPLPFFCHRQDPLDWHRRQFIAITSSCLEKINEANYQWSQSKRNSTGTKPGSQHIKCHLLGIGSALTRGHSNKSPLHNKPPLNGAINYSPQVKDPTIQTLCNLLEKTYCTQHLRNDRTPEQSAIHSQ